LSAAELTCLKTLLSLIEIPPRDSAMFVMALLYSAAVYRRISMLIISFGTNQAIELLQMTEQ
jgi:hypothetical protein